MINLLLASLAFQASDPSMSPLTINEPTSFYRLIFMVAPNDTDEDGWRIEEAHGLVLVDVGNMRRGEGGSKRLPIVYVRPRVEGQPNREVVVFENATVRCGRDYDSGPLHYEIASGPVPLSRELRWRPRLRETELAMISDIACTPGKPGSNVGPMSREKIVNLLNPTDGVRGFTLSPVLDFPERARTRGVLAGSAEIDCFVWFDGTTSQCEIVSETPSGMGFGQSALRAMSRARFVSGEDGFEKIKLDFQANSELRK